MGTPCEICGYKNHLTANYYRLVVYPPDFKGKRKPLSIGNSYEATQHYSDLNNSRSRIFNHAGTGKFRPHANNVASNNMLPDKQKGDHMELSNEELEMVRNLLHNKSSE